MANSDKIKTIMGRIQESYTTNKLNIQQYHQSRRMLYRSTLTDDEIALLKQMGRPTLEFNISRAYVSRLVGEFVGQEPSMEVRQENAMQQIDPRMRELVEGITRAIFDDAKNDFLPEETYEESLSGGWSVWKIYTDYANSMSFDQKIFVKKVFDPTLCGFDVTARESHKGDGRFCFELYPKRISEISAEYGSKYTKDLKAQNDLSDFNWVFKGADDDIALVGDYYEKVKVPATIVQLVTGDVMTIDDYEQFVDEYSAIGFIAQPPGIVGKPRETMLTRIKRSVVIQDKIIFTEPMDDWSYLPLINFAGNTQMIRDSERGEAYELAIPYTKAAEGVQRLMNFSGQCLANELENILQSKIMAPVKAIPKNYQDAYRNPQTMSVLLYNHQDENGKEVPPPQIIPRPPAPPEIANTFMGASQIMQSILGTFDANMIKTNDLSGLALAQAATQSNSSAMPYVVGYLKGMNQAANIIVDLLPKYYKTERTVPVITKEGKRGYVLINHQQGVPLKYGSNALQICVSAGVNFQIQQQQALNAMISLAKESQTFAEFLNAYGLEILLDNLDIRSVDQLKQAAPQFMQQLQQQQKQSQQMNPQVMQAQLNQAKIQLEQIKLQQDAQQAQLDAQLRAADIAVNDKNADTQRAKVMAEIGQNQTAAELEAYKTTAEIGRTQTEMAIKAADSKHSKALDLLSLHHDNLNKANALKNKVGDNANTR